MECPGCGAADDAIRALGVVVPAIGADAAPGRPAWVCSPSCWAARDALAARELADLGALGVVHQLLVDVHGVQHGPPERPITVAFGLAGLHLALERGLGSEQVRSAHQRMATARRTWPWFARPRDPAWSTVVDALSAPDHVTGVRDWATSVWEACAVHHDEVAALVEATAWG